MVYNRIRLTILLSLVLILFAGTVLEIVPMPVRDLNAMRDRFWILKTHKDDPVDMVLLGSSMVYRGLSPGAMQEVLEGYRIFNFAFSRGGLNPTIYREAEDLLDPLSNKRAVVLGINPATLWALTSTNDELRIWKSRDPWEVFLALHLSPVYKFLFPIDPEEFLRPATSSRYHEVFHDDGWAESWIDPLPDEAPQSSSEDGHRRTRVFLLAPHVQSAPRAERRAEESEEGVSPALLDALVRQTESWVQEGIHVFGFRPPTEGNLEPDAVDSRGFSEAAIARAVQDAGGVWFFISSERYHTLDGTHLDRDSAILFSRDLAGLIQAWLEEYAAQP